MIRGSQTKAALAPHIAGEPEDVSELVASMRTDYAVALAERTFRSTVKQAKVSVTAEGGDARGEVLADQLNDLYWRKLPAMLDCVAYGRVAFEKVWQYNEAAAVNFIDDLNELPYAYTKLRIDQHGRFDGIELKPQGKKHGVNLEPLYAWWLALDATPLNPHGTSRYLGAPQKIWQDRKENFCRLRQFIKRFVLGGGVAHIPTEPEIDPSTGEKVDPFDVLQKNYDDLLAGGFIAMSNERERNADGTEGEYKWDLDKMEIQVRDGRPILDIIDASDAWMLLAFGFPPKTIIEGDAVGSFALVSMQMLLLWSVADEIVDQITSSYQQYVVDKVGEINGIRGLTVYYTPLTERPDDIANELMKAWLTSPQLSPLVSAVDLEALFETVGIPVSPDALDRLKKVQATLAIPAPPVDPLQVRARAPDFQLQSGGFLNRLWK